MAARTSLVVVESPTKVKTIQKYLDRGFVVKASLGHLKDLPKSKLGIDVKKGFAPQYVPVRTKAKTLEELKKAGKKAKALYVATDPDREGEAIGWHIAQELKIPPEKVYRVLFNEITEKAVKAAFKEPGRIDQKRVDAQQARRVLDRLVGYKISPLLWEKIRRGLSAGRVQSVAVRLICEREQEIRAFVPQEYWSLQAYLTGAVPPEFVATLREKDGAKLVPSNETETRAIMAELERLPFVVKAVERGERRKNPSPPFITSTLQQDAARKLRFSASKTMMIAQQLYEGVEIDNGGPVGLITYMRTDSPRVAAEAQAAARDVIAARYGAETLPERPPFYRARKSAQEAHEAIRPSLLDQPPERLARHLSRDQLGLYRLIWERFLASQMRPALYDTLTVDVSAGPYLFRAVGSALRSPGFMAVYIEAPDESVGAAEEEGEMSGLPPLETGQRLGLVRLDPKQHFTQPPPRYTEASLVKELEEKGIGRPSTYAQILSTIQKREYVQRDRGSLSPTDLGETVNNLLVKAFPHIFEVAFTAQMEESLDEIEEGDRKWVEAVREFYKPFEGDLKEAGLTMEDFKAGKPTDETCPKCGEGKLLEKWGRYGRFLACERYPDCKYTRNPGDAAQAEPEQAGVTCDKCGKPMVYKQSRFGRFIGCSGYPECKNIKKITLGIPCPQGCGGELVENRSKRGRAYFGCSNFPECRFVVWQRPVPVPCPKCGMPFLTQRGGRGKRWVACSRENCDYRRDAEIA